MQPFFGAGQEDTSRARDFVLDAGEPGFLLGDDTGPSPMEALLHALAACLTTSVVYIAAARKVQLTEVTSALEGDIDLGGCFGLSDEVRNGFEAIRVRFTIKGDAPEREAAGDRRARPGALGHLRRADRRRAGGDRGRHGLNACRRG